MTFLDFLKPRKRIISECVGCPDHPSDLVSKYNGGRVFRRCPVRARNSEGEVRRHRLNVGLRNDGRNLD